MSWFEEKEGSIIINIRVVPRASKDAIQGLMDDGALKVRIQAPPVDGKANAYLIRFLAKQWKIPRTTIVLLSGETGRSKRMQITAPSNQLVNILKALENK